MVWGIWERLGLVRKVWRLDMVGSALATARSSVGTADRGTALVAEKG